MNINENCRAMVRRAESLDRQGRLREAIEAYRHLLAQWPDLPDSWYNLGLLQRKTGEFPAALASYHEALRRGIAQPEEVHLNRGVIFSDCLRRYDAAERELNQALALNPGYVPALVNLANLHEDLGRRELAAGVYEQILALAPEHPQALARYAGLKTFSSLDDPLIARLRGAGGRRGLSAGDRADVEFALGRALDACGAYDAAFEVFKAANLHSRESAGASFRSYDPHAQERYVDRLIEAFPAAIRPECPSLTSPRPVFICGMFRSGSTLTEQLLAGHPQVEAGGELDFLPRTAQTQLAPFPESMALASGSQLETLALDYMDLLRGSFPHATFVTDKRPDNFLYIGLIMTLFPDAKIVHTTRDALDNCLSIYFLHLDQGMNYALDLMDVGHYYAQYLRLMAHWKALFGGAILDSSYDELVVDPKSVMESIQAFLGLQADERCLLVPTTGRAVKTASVWQVREPLYQRASGRSQHYIKHLETLTHYLQRVVRLDLL
jgi:Sulfotransferase family/Tetratricopeptide repeat